MADIIQVLPDSVANQIAAGEVIQRPASVVKELVENAVDAGGTDIQVHVKDAGRTLIQIIDNGCGMSDTDARLAFERHATSKIRSAEDIFSIRTMGFRGEALASIAAIAQVECRTKQHSEELGTHIVINGSKLERQENTSCKNGTIFSIKNIFYNIPARRKFMKSNNTEFGYILSEFNRVCLANPNLSFSLFHNDKPVHKLPAGNLKQRIINLYGKANEKNLLNIESKTNLVSIKGFIGKPELAKKKNHEQFFFVNNRYMKHKSFYGAVMRAFENLIPQGSYPSFFIFFDIDPADIDVNIHPTKTEIKFTDEFQIAQILEATVREALGKFNIVPSIDFSDTRDYNDMFKPASDTIKVPGIEIDPSYNPFNTSPGGKTNSGKSSSTYTGGERDTGNPDDWEKLYDGINSIDNEPRLQFDTKPSALNNGGDPETKKEQAVETGRFLQLKGRYILTAVKSGMMIIDQKRAHERILYEHYLDILSSKKVASQKSLFPVTLDVTPEEFVIICEIKEELTTLGYDIEEFGKNMFVINGTPSEPESQNIEEILHGFIQQYTENNETLKVDTKDSVAKAMARSSSVSQTRQMSAEEMQKLTDQLFACSAPNLSAYGKKTIEIISIEELQKRFL